MSLHVSLSLSDEVHGIASDRVPAFDGAIEENAVFLERKLRIRSIDIFEDFLHESSVSVCSNKVYEFVPIKCTSFLQ